MIRRASLLAPTLALLVAACGGSGASTLSSPGVTGAPASDAAMEVMGKGEFQPVDGTATGVAELAVLADGTYEVILEDFSIGSADHTNVVLVANDRVTATGDIDKSMLLDLGPLQAVDGMQAYRIPADMAGAVMDGYHSVVIWDTEMAHAIAAASLS